MSERINSYILSVCDVASILNISKSKAYDLMRTDSFPSLRVGKRILVPRDRFEAWIDQQISSNRNNE